MAVIVPTIICRKGTSVSIKAALYDGQRNEETRTDCVEAIDQWPNGHHNAINDGFGIDSDRI